MKTKEEPFITTQQRAHNFQPAAEAAREDRLRALNWQSQALAMVLVLFSLALSLLSYHGVFTNAADEPLMLAVTENLVKHGQINVDQLFWIGNYANLASFGQGGHLYSKHSLGQSLLATPLYWISLHNRQLGGVQTTILLTAIATALTNLFFFLSLRKLDFSPHLSLVVTLASMLGTPSWVYAKTFESEPLSGLALMALFYFLLANFPVWVGICFGLALLTKTANVVALPAVLVYLFGLHTNLAGIRWRPLWQSCWRFGIPVAVALLGIGLYNWGRFGNIFTTGYEQEHFSTPLFTGLYGQLFSPGKGLFLYAPIVLASMAGFPLLYRRNHPLAFAVFIIFAAYLITFGTWHAWYGSTVSWGPRFLIPIVPLLMLPLAALLAQLNYSRSRKSQAIICGVALLSVFIQFQAVAYDYRYFTAEVGTPTLSYRDFTGQVGRHLKLNLRDEDTAARSFYFSPRLSPLLNQSTLARAEHADIAWWRYDDRTHTSRILLRPFLIGLAFFILALATLIAAILPQSTIQRRRYTLLFLILSVLAVLPAHLMSMNSYYRSAAFDDPQYRQAWQQLSSAGQPGDGVISLDAERFATALNSDKSSLEHYGFSNTWTSEQLLEQAALAPDLALLQKAMQAHPRLWVLRMLTPQQPEGSTGIEQILKQRYQDGQSYRYGDTVLTLYTRR